SFEKIVSLRREERAEHSWLVSDVTHDGADDGLGGVHVHVMKFLAVFPPAMNDGRAFRVTSLHVVVELHLSVLVVCEEVRDTVPKTLAYAIGLGIGAEEGLKALPEERISEVARIR